MVPESIAQNQAGLAMVRLPRRSLPVVYTLLMDVWRLNGGGE